MKFCIFCVFLDVYYVIIAWMPKGPFSQILAQIYIFSCNRFWKIDLAFLSITRIYKIGRHIDKQRGHRSESAIIVLCSACD